jgi:hypothetical protein
MIRGLPIEEADEFLGTLRLAGIAAVEQNLGLTGMIRHGNLPPIVNNRRRSSFHRQAERCRHRRLVGVSGTSV